MALYTIGDVQGCFEALEDLLSKIQFNPYKDELWFTGDLVNRGPDSLRTLHFIKNLGKHASCVLGNHDLHLLKIDAGIKPASADGTLDDILHSDARNELIQWLRHQPLLKIDYSRQLVMVHAGLIPHWDLNTASQLANEIENKLQSENYQEFLTQIHNSKSNFWYEDMNINEALEVAINTMTHIRICDQQGYLDLSYKKSLAEIPAGFKAWFDWPHQRDLNFTVIIGHWAALGFLQRKNLLALDTGCVWGNQLTAYCVDTKQRFSVNCS